MKRSTMVVVFLLYLGVLIPDMVQGQMQQQYLAATLEVSQPRARSLTLTFGSRKLAQLEANPYSVLGRLDSATRKDCAFPKRISNCIWACNNGRKIRTCHPQLMRALERVWPK